MNKQFSFIKLGLAKELNTQTHRFIKLIYNKNKNKNKKNTFNDITLNTIKNIEKQLHEFDKIQSSLDQKDYEDYEHKIKKRRDHTKITIEILNLQLKTQYGKRFLINYLLPLQIEIDGISFNIDKLKIKEQLKNTQKTKEISNEIKKLKFQKEEIEQEYNTFSNIIETISKIKQKYDTSRMLNQLTSSRSLVEKYEQLKQQMLRFR